MLIRNIGNKKGIFMLKASLLQQGSTIKVQLSTRDTSSKRTLFHNVCMLYTQHWHITQRQHRTYWVAAARPLVFRDVQTLHLTCNAVAVDDPQIPRKLQVCKAFLTISFNFILVSHLLLPLCFRMQILCWLPGMPGQAEPG